MAKKSGKVLSEVQQMPPANAKVHIGDEIEFHDKPGKSGSVEHVSTKRMTVEEVLAAANVSEVDWEITDIVVNQWDGFAKIKETGLIKIVTLYQTKIKLKPRQSRWIYDVADLIAKRHKNYKPDYKGYAPKKEQVQNGPWLAVLGLFDVHLGKLAWHGETGVDYDLKVATRGYRDAVSRMLDVATLFPVGRWRISIGQDFLHIDSNRNETTAGTPQDVDGRFAKIVVAAEELFIETIDKCMTIAPVELVYDASNHDRHASWQIARALYRHYNSVPDSKVHVDTSWMGRKYLQWGKNLLGVAHGHEEKLDRLVTLMPQECPEMWSKTTFREWLLGHLHSKRIHIVKEAAETDGVSVRHLRSLSATDAWHYSKGYVTDRAAELHMYHLDGQVQHRTTFRLKDDKSKRVSPVNIRKIG